MKLEILEEYKTYHIFNRGINSASIFRTEDNKLYFLKLADKYLQGKMDLLGYCIMGNHFHLIIRLNVQGREATQSLSNLFNAYAKVYNKQNSRTGSLFEKHFRRKQVDSETYLKNLICYVHLNPFWHKTDANWKDYEFSSYRAYTGKSKQNIVSNTNYVLGLFENLENFIATHHQMSKTGIKTNLDLQGFQNLAGPTFDSNIKNQFYQYIQNLQDTITSKLEVIDGKATFKEDLWKRPEGGGGRTRVIENGTVFEKGGVNISAVYGKLPQSMQAYFKVGDVDFFACGLSLVIHPKSPMVPTVHANWRYFEMYDKSGTIVDQWFGGGQDLTPYYLFKEDAKHFHQVCKNTCDKHHPEFYAKYKARCDQYFFNTHRNEARGIGGLFFDYCKATKEMSMQDWYNFVTDVGNSFLNAYAPIVEKRKNLEYNKDQRDWQEIRRGRYVEFNLVHDKGTLFGLKTNGRIESILMSLPPHVQWHYNHQPEEGTEEAKLLKVLKDPVDWV